jgi:hypothetical protein
VAAVVLGVVEGPGSCVVPVLRNGVVVIVCESFADGFAEELNEFVQF